MLFQSIPHSCRPVVSPDGRDHPGLRPDQRRLVGDCADRRRHLHRQRHPRLPRPPRRVDQEPRSREDGHAQLLRVGSRRAKDGLAEPHLVTGVDGRAQRRPPRWSSSKPAAHSSPRTSTASITRRAATPTASSRSTATCERSSAWAATSGRPWSGRWTGFEPVRRTRPAAPVEDPQVSHHLLRGVARCRRPGARRAGGPGVRPHARHRVQPDRLPGVRRCPHRQARRRPGGHPQRPGDPVRRPGRRGAPRLHLRAAAANRRAGVRNPGRRAIVDLIGRIFVGGR